MEVMGKKRILVVEDDMITARNLAASLRNIGYDAFAVVSTGEEAINLAIEQKPDLILMDMALQGPLDGIQTAERIRSSIKIPIIYITAHSGREIIERAKITEPFGYMIKPYEENELLFAIEMALYKHDMQEKLRKQNEFMQHILDSLTHPFYVINADDYTIELSNKAANFGDLSEKPKCYSMTHKETAPCMSEEHPCPMKIVKETGKAVVLEHVHYDKDGKKRDVEVNCYPIFDSEGKVSKVIEYTLDISERKQLEKKLIAAQKMESIGRLASGVAHDFSNIMSAVLGFSEMAMLEISEDHPVYEKLKIIRDAGEKAAALTQQLLAFSSKQVLQMKPLNLNNIVKDMASMLSRTIGENIRLEMKTNEQVLNIMADQGQIEQILLNLVLNSRDAMPRGGRLTIETSDIHIGEGDLIGSADIKPGSYVLFTVTDTGEGMSKEIMEKIFEPFFTTKQKGKGTGLGLSTVYGIVKQHKGHVSVYSELSRGTTFKIYLPSLSAETGAKTETAPKVMARGTETIFVVDDDKAIRRLVRDMLEPLGYKVLEASNAEEALERIKSYEGEIDMLLTDIVMSGMSGMELSEAVGILRPQIEIIFMSGYADTDAARRGENFMQKPINVRTLAAKIRGVLDNRDKKI